MSISICNTSRKKGEVNSHNFAEFELTQLAIILNPQNTKNYSSPKETLTVKYLLEKGIIHTRKFYSLANHTSAKEEQHNSVFQTMLYWKKFKAFQSFQGALFKFKVFKICWQP